MNPIKIESTQNSDTLEIRWTPNNVCNYKCQYCWPESNAGNYASPKNLDLIIKNFNHLIGQYKNRLGKTKIRLTLSGGEPTLWRELAEFIEGIKKENDIYLSLLTNGSRTIRWWKEYGHLIDNAHISYHIAFANPDHVISVADTLFEFDKKVTVKVLMDNRRWQEGIDVIDYMKTHSQYSWFIMTDEVIEPGLQLSEEQKKFLKNSLHRIPNFRWLWKNRNLFRNGHMRVYESNTTFDSGETTGAKSNTYINNNWNNFQGWSCNIGLENIFINWDGNIQGSCQQSLYGKQFYYNILDTQFVEKFNPEFKPVICSKGRCVCSPETHVSKFKLS